jgi:hypothetical protein
MHDRDPVDRIFAKKAAVLGWIAGPPGYAGILIQFPEYWAIATALAFIIASGLFTTKIVLGFTNPMATFGLVPVFGAGWLIFIWLMLKLMG